MTRGMRFSEAMVGSWQSRLGTAGGAFGFDVDVETDELLKPLGTTTGRLVGTLHADGLAERAAATGTIEVSPVEQKRIRYTLEFRGDDGHPYRFDGWKSIEWRHLLGTWTTLPGTIYDAAGAVVGTAQARFPLRDTASLVASLRLLPPGTPPAADLFARRSDGTPGRLEVWYDTFTDPATGTGFWLHHELVTPAAGGAPEAHGWAAVFPPDAPPVWARFGPGPLGESPAFRVGDVVAEHGVRAGSAGDLSWELAVTDTSPPLFTFPRSTWSRELLPAAQIVPSPTASFAGTVRCGTRAWTLAGAPGGAARIYGHGNAERWAWLHADLGGGDVLEIVAAVSRRPGLNRLPPMPFVQLRVDGADWPSNPLAAAPRFKAEVGLPVWTVKGRSGDRRIEVTVTQPEERCVAIPYRDPDGATATCTNTERADVRIVVERRTGGTWALERSWRLDATAHAEVGTRP